MRNFPPTNYLSLAFRLGSLSFLLNIAMEMSGVFLPLYARSLGASNLEVGLIAATYGMSFFLSSLFLSRQSDIHGRLAFIRSGLGLSAIAYLSQAITPTPMMLLIARGFIGFCLGVTSAAILSYTYENQKQIGSFASYGSLGWLFGALVAAVIRNYEALFLASTIASVLAFWLSLTLREEKSHRIQVAIFPISLITANSRVYFALLLRQIGANAIWAIFPLFLTGIGANQIWIALMDGINTGTQFLAMRFVERFNPVTAFRTGLLLSTLVFAIYSIATNYLQIVPVQVFLALAWSCLFVGALNYLLRHNVEHGTVSGLLYSTVYLSSTLGPFLGGAVAQIWGFVTLMQVGSGLSFFGFLSSQGLKTREGTPPHKISTP